MNKKRKQFRSAALFLALILIMTAAVGPALPLMAAGENCTASQSFSLPAEEMSETEPEAVKEELETQSKTEAETEADTEPETVPVHEWEMIAESEMTKEEAVHELITDSVKDTGNMNTPFLPGDNADASTEKLLEGDCTSVPSCLSSSVDFTDEAVSGLIEVNGFPWNMNLHYFNGDKANIGLCMRADYLSPAVSGADGVTYNRNDYYYLNALDEGQRTQVMNMLMNTMMSYSSDYTFCYLPAPYNSYPWKYVQLSLQLAIWHQFWAAGVPGNAGPAASWSGLTNAGDYQIRELAEYIFDNRNTSWEKSKGTASVSMNNPEINRNDGTITIRVTASSTWSTDGVTLTISGLPSDFISVTNGVGQILTGEERNVTIDRSSGTIVIRTASGLTVSPNMGDVFTVCYPLSKSNLEKTVTAAIVNRSNLACEPEVECWVPTTSVSGTLYQQILLIPKSGQGGEVTATASKKSDWRDDEFLPDVEFLKLDAETGKAISGAEMKVVAAEDIIWLGRMHYQAGDVVKEWISTGKRELIEDVYPGKYTLMETNAPFGYQLSKTISFDVGEADPDDEATQTITVSMEDAQTCGKVIINKTDKDTNKPLSGVVFELRIANDVQNAAGTVVMKAGTVVETLVTDESGHVESEEIPIGVYGTEGFTSYIRYELQEIKALTGYVLDETVYEIEFTYEGDHTPVVEKTFAFINTSVPILTMPETGSRGRILCYGLGALSMSSGAVLLLSGGHKQKKNKKADRHKKEKETTI